MGLFVEGLVVGDLVVGFTLIEGFTLGDLVGNRVLGVAVGDLDGTEKQYIYI